MAEPAGRTMRICRASALPEGLPELARVAAAEGFRMLDVLARDWADGTHRFAAPGEALFVAQDGAGRLLGVGGITRDPWVDALRMRRFYVSPEARGSGVGRALARSAIDQARAAGVAMVRLRAPAAAGAFWEAIGFRPWPDDPTATHVLTLSAAETAPRRVEGRSKA